MTLKYEIQALIIAIKSGIPNSIQDEYLADRIIKLIGKKIDECKTIEEIKEMVRERNEPTK